MISLIATIFNEEKNVESWLRSLFNQTQLPDELVIVDGGSTDQTWEKLKIFQSRFDRLKIFQHPGNIAVGRNYAISKAAGDIIVVADAGCRYHNNWLETITKPLVNKTADWSATAFGPWLEKNDSLIAYLIAASTTPAWEEFVGKSWLPSSRSVAFAKSLWQKVGGYPEWLPICEDVIFDLTIQKTGARFESNNQPMVFWKPRANLLLYVKQLYKYTRGDGQGQLWLGRQLIRYGVYGGSLLWFCFSLAVQPWLLVILGVGLVVYMIKFWLRFFEFSKEKNHLFKVGGLIGLPLVVALGDVAKMIGWPIGVWQRLQGKIKYQSY